MPSAVATIAIRLACATSLAFLALGARAAPGQRPLAVGARPPVLASSDSLALEQRPPLPGRGWLNAFGNDASPWWAPVASLVVPGTGQAAMRQTRGVAYIAAEAYAWVQAREFRREENRRRSESRRRALEVARAPFLPKRDTTEWSYYEAMEENIESGPFSLTPGGPVTPPMDVSTYNGKQWLAARSLYWDPDTPLPTSDPRYQRALAYYTAHAVSEEFRWSWRDQQIQWLSYQADIARENQLSRDVTMTLVVIGANHLVSAIDALASVRLRESRGPLGERRIEAAVPLPGFGRRPPGRQ